MKLNEFAFDSYSPYEKEVMRKIENYVLRRGDLGQFLVNPYAYLTTSPLRICLCTVPVAFSLAIIAVILGTANFGVNAFINGYLGENIFLMITLTIFIPASIVHEKRAKFVRETYRTFPILLRDMAGLIASGMNLPAVVMAVTRNEYGSLDPFLERLELEISWGIPFIISFRQFGTKIGTIVAERATELISDAHAAGGDVSLAIRDAANECEEISALFEDRWNGMIIYIAIVFVAFLVFLMILVILTTTFLSSIVSPGNAGNLLAYGQKGVIDLNIYKRIFFHAACIEAIFSGLCAGKLGTGTVKGGLIYASFMLGIVWVVFSLFILFR